MITDADGKAFTWYLLGILSTFGQVRFATPKLHSLTMNEYRM